MAGGLRLKYNDYDGDQKQVTIPVVTTELPADYAGWETATQGLSAAINNLTVGNPAGADLLSVLSPADTTPAASPAAQAGLSMVIEYTAVSNNRNYSIKIPMPDLSLGTGVWVRSNKLTTLDLASTEGAALKTEFDARAQHILSDGTRSAVVLQRAYIEE